MTRGKSQDFNDLRELAAGWVLGDLSVEETVALKNFDPQEVDEQLASMEKSAAALQWAMVHQHSETMPSHLRQRILATQGISSTKPSGLSVATPKVLDMGKREYTAWVAMAASLLLAFTLWMTRGDTRLVPRDSALADRRELLRSASDILQVSWDGGKTPFDAPVEGDVVWSNKNQAGYMRFVGMPKNDPRVEQYQLWIIDPARDDEPIDGGVFDINSDGEAIVPIHAKLQVLKPAAFAITIEKPGGVVVSTQERLPLLAKAVP